MTASTSPEGNWLAALGARLKEAPALYGSAEIEQMIPHRDPFVLIDDIVEFDRERILIVGRKRVLAHEAVLRGHFPGAPIFPGVYIVEALAQTGGVLIHLMGHQGKVPVIVRLNHATFRRPVFPGATLMTICEGIHLTGRGGRMRTTAVIGDRVCAHVEIGYTLVEIAKLHAEHPHREDQ